MDDNKFWALTWIILGVTISVLVVGLLVRNTLVSYSIERAIKGGTDPIAAACSIGNCQESTMIAIGLGQRK